MPMIMVKTFDRVLQAIRQKNDRVIRVIIFSLISMTMFLMLFTNVTPEKLDVEIFTVSEKDIISPTTVEDKVATEKAKNEAAAQIEDQYTYYSVYKETQVKSTEDLFESIVKVNAESLQVGEGENSPLNNNTIKGKLEETKSFLPEDIRESISDQTLEAFLSAEPSQLNMAKEITVTAVNDAMSGKIKVGDIETKKEEVSNKMRYSGLNEKLRNAMTETAQLMIIPNYLYDPETTAQKRSEAKEQVEPVVIRSGEVLVKKGQVVTRDIYDKMKLAGLLDQETTMKPYIGIGIIIILLTLLLSYFFRDIQKSARNHSIYLVIYLIIFSLMFTVMKLISLFQTQGAFEVGYIVPVAAATMLIKMLIDEKIALVSSFLFAVGGSIMFNGAIPSTIHFSIGIYLFFSGVAGVIFLDKQNHRVKILKAGLLISTINLLVIAALTLLKYNFYSGLMIGIYIGYGLLSGFLSAVLTLGLIPFFEAGFGMLSTMKLIELSNPNHPLLRKILMETPGTYHHSVMVANLSEAACEAIGVDGLLARVGSYYHDIGKSKRPAFFIENQMNLENPHDKLSPFLSKTIILSHVTDGAAILREHKFPKEIIDIAEQHHGTTLLKYFYKKAIDQAGPNDAPIKEADFRYPGPKPQFKESAVIGIADSVEAAVRSLTNPTKEEIEDLVRKIITDRLRDGQFNECDITLKELDIVARTMCETLQGIFHSRIKYPELDEKKVKEA